MRRLSHGFLAMLAVLAGLVAYPAMANAAPTSAVSRADPPDVRGLDVTEARAKLEAWDTSVQIQLLPQQLPAGVDQSTVVVATQTLVNPAAPGTTVIRPQVRLGLGTRVPDLGGLTAAEATRVLASRGLTLRGPPAQARPDWTISAQAVPAQTIVEFGLTIGTTFAAPTTTPDLRTVALIGGAGLLVLLLLGLLALRSVRRRSARRRTQAPVETIVVRGHAGPPSEPSLVENGRPDVVVGLRPRYDPGAFTFEEVGR